MICQAKQGKRTYTGVYLPHFGEDSKVPERLCTLAKITHNLVAQKVLENSSPDLQVCVSSSLSNWFNSVAATGKKNTDRIGPLVCQSCL